MLISLVGGDKVEASSLSVSLLNSDGKELTNLPLQVIKAGSSFKLKISFKPPNQGYRVQVKGELIPLFVYLTMLQFLHR